MINCFAKIKFSDRLGNNSASIITYVYVPSKKRTLESNARRDCAGSRNVLFSQNQRGQPTRMHPRTTPFIMREHSTRASENLEFLINITVVHYRNAYVAVARICTHSEHPPEYICERRLVTSEQHDRLRLHRVTPSFPKPARYILRRNARVITINLYDRFTSHRLY